jgi:hypothetical protein
MSQLNDIRFSLSQIKSELTEKYHVSTIGLFGSIVRDDFTSKSDIDIIVDFSQPIGVEFIDLANYIELKLKKQIDLVSKKGIKQSYMKQIEKEIVYV